MSRPTPVPMNDFPAQIARRRAELQAAFDRVLDSGWFILGPEVEAFVQFLLDNADSIAEEVQFVPLTDEQKQEALGAFDDWLEQHLDSLRRNPGEDLLSQLVRVPGCVCRLGGDLAGDIRS